MTWRRFLVLGIAGLLLSAGCLVLGALLDSPSFAVAGTVLIGAVVAAREAWIWRGDGRRWLVVAGGLMLVIAVAFAASKLDSA